MAVEKNAFCILLINSTETTPQPTLAGSNQFVVKHAGIGRNAVGHARSMVGLGFLGKKGGEINCHELERRSNVALRFLRPQLAADVISAGL